MGIETSTSSIHAMLGPEFAEYFSQLVYNQCTALGFRLTGPMPTAYADVVKWARKNRKIQRKNGWEMSISPPIPDDTYYIMISLRKKGSDGMPIVFQYYEKWDYAARASYPFTAGLFKDQPEALAVMQGFVGMVATYSPTQVKA